MALQKFTRTQIALLAGLGCAGAGALWVRSKTPDLRGDLWFLRMIFTVLIRCKRRLEQNVLVPDWFEAQIQTFPPDSVFMYFVDTDRAMTFHQLHAESNRVANWALAEGIRSKDVVALMLENCPEYVAIWLGLSKIGVTTALINTHLRGHPLLETLRSSQASRFVIGHENVPHLTQAFAAAANRPVLPGAKWFELHGHTTNVELPFVALSPLLADAAVYPIARRHRSGVTAHDSLLHIYTSGTTGLPKAAHFSHLRFMLAAESFVLMGDMRPSDRLYTSLPMYHTAGGVVAPGVSFVVGLPLVVRRKHSTQQFWSDCVKYRVTVVQYIGELCRYLLNAPPHPDEKRHTVRLAFGNGLRADVWSQFVARFRVPWIYEFYASTEGNATLGNPFNRVGAVGRMTDLVQLLIPVRLVRVDAAREQPIRDAAGRCVQCKSGEVGELIGRIDDDNPIRRFQGYTSRADTDKKILTDVFRRGDRWFRTGDLLMHDAEGYFYFVDRVGDTFRWRGENCSTAEVETVLQQVPGVREANVYGVKVFQQDGRAGMAALVIDPETFQLQTLHDVCRKNLPLYAVPLFVRVLSQMDVTGTFKQKKVDLVRDGFDPNHLTDPLYFRDDQKKCFVKLDPQLFELLQGPKARL